MNATETETTLNSNLFLGGRIREFHAGKSGFKGCLYQLIIGWDFVKKESLNSLIFSLTRGTDTQTKLSNFVKLQLLND